jgi:hypothetical protein
MKKEVNAQKKLKLNRETLRGLEEPALDDVLGGLTKVACGGTTCNTRLTCSTNLC